MNSKVIRRSNLPSNYIGLILKKQRRKLGLSGKAIAKLLHISQQQVSRYECGVTNFNINILFRFFSVLKMNENEISNLFNELTSYYQGKGDKSKNTHIVFNISDCNL